MGKWYIFQDKNDERNYKIIIASIFHDFKLRTEENQDLERLYPRNHKIENNEFKNHTVEVIDILKRLNIKDKEIFEMV